MYQCCECQILERLEILAQEPLTRSLSHWLLPKSRWLLPTSPCATSHLTSCPSARKVQTAALTSGSSARLPCKTIKRACFPKSFLPSGFLGASAVRLVWWLLTSPPDHERQRLLTTNFTRMSRKQSSHLRLRFTYRATSLEVQLLTRALLVVQQ